MGWLHDGPPGADRARPAPTTPRPSSRSSSTRASSTSRPDYTRYPRNEARDLAICEAEGVDLVFAPDVEEVYPPGFDTTVSVGAVARPLEGAARPGHFDGVATVVAILFGLVGAERAYFGQKDAQQVMVIRQMARDLAIATEVIACPTVREPDGLALSSRNVHLSPGAAGGGARSCAGRCWRRASSWEAGERSAEALRDDDARRPSPRSRSPRSTTCRSPTA